MAVEDACSFSSMDLLEALERDFRSEKLMTENDKTTLLEKALSAIFLSLGDKVLRQVSKENITMRLWTDYLKPL